MTAVVTAIGWFVIAMLTLAFACSMVCLVLYCYQKAMERFEWAIDAKTRHEVGRSIRASSHWFSESPDTYLAIRILGDRLMTQGGADADQWREEWRKERSQVTGGESR